MTVSSSVTGSVRSISSENVTVIGTFTWINCDVFAGMVVRTVGAGSVLNS